MKCVSVSNDCMDEYSTGSSVLTRHVTSPASVESESKSNTVESESMYESTALESQSGFKSEIEPS